ncbi:hypothetical protein I3843_12G108400 [Carya illinoinensis]|uniref:Uncharacterized protein n=1 Tax=Carya illinoinensis TaxID=32201 RepID=A0A8T1NVX0_CARIL|nr:hypothetical protein I3760_12G106600 [Carya illinoinensis]KAG2677626.1 hypothetical protein I3760_12G106600 [Carya illinoinensis]KAG6634308.1 hypothetical protein CIPAW_12G109700 [Carya illinoinensis]KAG6634309.1 hypothetical protein CIPAW_12G109700 [Carya illinoinensis]KAG6685352.1 hypothetical protein I3842_12G108100 [Carya illinoinensis]
MGLPLVALAKLKLLSATYTTPSPLVTSLVWPFLLKLSFSFGLARRTYIDVVYAARLFFFQLGQIAFDTQPALGHNSRVERALRLVYQRVTHASRSQARELDADNFHTLSMIAL